MSIELEGTEFEEAAEELFRYVKDIMDLSPASALVILTKVSGKIIQEQTLSRQSRVDAYRLFAYNLAARAFRE